MLAEKNVEVHDGLSLEAATRFYSNDVGSGPKPIDLWTLKDGFFYKHLLSFTQIIFSPGSWVWA